MRNALLRALRVPPEPHPPEGSAGSLSVFRAGRNFYRWRLLAWAWAHALGIAGAIGTYVAINQVAERAARKSAEKAQRYADAIHQIWLLTEGIALVILLATMVLTFLVLRLNYELRWYMVTDRSLRIRHGIWSVHELTMTFANIQEIRVASGPIQNALGLADVVVSAAGGGSTDAHGHRTGGHKAAFEGVDNANEIRDLIVERLRIYRDSGLGETNPAAPADGSDALMAARNVLAEVRALRTTLS